MPSTKKPTKQQPRNRGTADLSTHADDAVLGSPGDPTFAVTMRGTASTRTTGAQPERQASHSQRPKSRRRRATSQADLAPAGSGGHHKRVRFTATESDPRPSGWPHRQLAEYRRRRRREIQAAVRDLQALRAEIMQAVAQVELDPQEDEEDEIRHFDGDDARVFRRRHDEDDDHDDFYQGRPLRAGT